MILIFSDSGRGASVPVASSANFNYFVDTKYLLLYRERWPICFPIQTQNGHQESKWSFCVFSSRWAVFGDIFINKYFHVMKLESLVLLPVLLRTQDTLKYPLYQLFFDSLINKKGTLKALHFRSFNVASSWIQVTHNVSEIIIRNMDFYSHNGL